MKRVTICAGIRIFVFFVVSGSGLLACAPVPLPVNTLVGPIGIKPVPLSAWLVLPDALRKATAIQDVPCAQEFSIPIGRELEKGSLQALSQAFDSLEMVSDKTTALGAYDVVIELGSPQLTFEGRCATRWLTYLGGPYTMWIPTSDHFTAQAVLSVTILDRNSQTIVADTFKSDVHGQVAVRSMYTGNDTAQKIGVAVQEALADAFREMTRGIVFSPKLRAYAQSIQRNPVASRVQTIEQALVKPSDVDELPPVLSVPQKNRYAVLIGIEQYRQNFPKVDFGTHDAKVMRDYLIKALGYPEENIAMLLNGQATRSDVEKYIERWLPNHVEKDSTVFVYYSGHGAPDTKTNEGYLVPYDGDPTFLDVTGYPLKRLYEQLAKLPAQEVVVVLDSCFSGAGGRSVLAKGMRPAAISVENPILTGGKTVVLAASSGAQISSSYSQKSHGLLTYFFLKGLQGEADQNQDSKIDLTELYTYLKPRVEAVARREFNNEQTPQLLGSPDILKRGVRLLEQGAR